jgi:hypothetical protein
LQELEHKHANILKDLKKGIYNDEITQQLEKVAAAIIKHYEK